MNEALQQKLVHARAKLLLSYPFFGFLAAHLVDRIRDDLPSQTAGTDGRNIYWHAAFLETLQLPDAVFILAHEVMHCVLMHIWRCGNRDKDAWNVAADAVINDILIAEGLRCSIPGITGANGKSTEELYRDLEALLKANKGKGLLDDHSVWGESPKDGDDNKAKDAVTADAWDAIGRTALQQGNAPKGMTRLLDMQLNPKKDWRQLLREGLQIPDDYSWTPCDRRFSHQGIMLPTLTGTTHRVVIAIDSSGSIYGERLNDFWTEVVAILRNNKCEARVLVCDAAIQNEWGETEFNPSLVASLGGGGGTDFVPVFERLNEYIQSGWTPEALVYLTDLDGNFPTEEPGCRVIWVVSPNDEKKPYPFGEAIVVNF